MRTIACFGFGQQSVSRLKTSKLFLFQSGPNQSDSFHFSVLPNHSLFQCAFVFLPRYLPIKPFCIFTITSISALTFCLFFKSKSASTCSPILCRLGQTRLDVLPSVIVESRCRHCKSNQRERKKGLGRRKRYGGWRGKKDNQKERSNEDAEKLRN